MAIEKQDILNTVTNSTTQVIEKNDTDFEAVAGVGIKTNIHYNSVNGQLRTREFIIRRIIHKDTFYYIDAIATDINAPRLIPVKNIVYIQSSVTNTIYNNPYQFIQNKLGVEVDNSLLNEDLTDFAKAIKELGPELTVLMYLVAIDGVRSTPERDYVLQYAKDRVPYLSYDEQEMLDYLVALHPDDDSFSTAFHRVILKGKMAVQPLLETILKIIVCDGAIHEKEKALLARLIDLLKQDGYDINLTI